VNVAENGSFKRAKLPQGIYLRLLLWLVTLRLPHLDVYYLAYHLPRDEGQGVRYEEIDILFEKRLPARGRLFKKHEIDLRPMPALAKLDKCGVLTGLGIVFFWVGRIN
jgi:hypothetical protein